MRFNVLHVDPPGFHAGYCLHFFDQLLYFGLLGLGHDCNLVRNRPDPEAVNVIVCGHMLDRTSAAQIMRTCPRFIVLQTELLGETERVCWRSDTEFHGIYLPFLRRALAVWETSPEQVSLLQNWGVTTARALTGGYLPALEAHYWLGKDRDIDYLFVGASTKRRAPYLEALSSHGRLVVSADDPAIFKYELLQRAKVCVSLQSYGQTFLPWARICEQLHWQSLIVSEAATDQEWLQDCFLHTIIDKWVELCREVAAQPEEARRERQRLSFERFKQKPFIKQLREALSASL